MSAAYVNGEDLPAQQGQLSLEYSTTPADDQVSTALAFFLVMLSLLLIATIIPITFAVWSWAF